MAKRAKQTRSVKASSRAAASPDGTKQAVLDENARNTVEDAVHALYRIQRLALRAFDDEDVESFCMAITEISQLHGKALDDCLRRAGGGGVGCFDKGVGHG
jgi:hypothetical protein